MTTSARQAAVARLHRARLDGTELWLPVAGRSMGSTIDGGGRVRVVDAERRPKRGEIWAFTSESGTVVVHRYRSRHGDQYWFRGDANPRDDEPVAAAALVGRVVEIDDDRGRRPVGFRDRWIGRVRLDRHSVERAARVSWNRIRVRLTSSDGEG